MCYVISLSSQKTRRNDKLGVETYLILSTVQKNIGRNAKIVF